MLISHFWNLLPILNFPLTFKLWAPLTIALNPPGIGGVSTRGGVWQTAPCSSAPGEVWTTLSHQLQEPQFQAQDRAEWKHWSREWLGAMLCTVDPSNQPSNNTYKAKTIKLSWDSVEDRDLIDWTLCLVRTPSNLDPRKVTTPAFKPLWEIPKMNFSALK